VDEALMEDFDDVKRFSKINFALGKTKLSSSA
jgi:hypothetical protein